MDSTYDVIVIGAGHAGCEAAHAAARMGARTLLVTMDMNKIAQMSCNPAVGGIAKGQIVREIDALGGKIGEVADATSLQFRLLNRSKGPAVWSPRAQCDRGKYIWEWRRILENTEGLNIWQDTVTEFIFSHDDGLAVAGCRTAMGVTFHAKQIVLTAGTFLNGLMHIGRTKLEGGRVAEAASYGLTEQLRSVGFATGRMKTGTPMRLDGRTIDFSLAERQDGESGHHRFSFLDSPRGELRQLPCWTVYTNENVHEVLRRGLPDSPLYNGQIQSIGPRYCPSIETKIVTFADKQQHLLFIEPEGETTQEYYLNGFSSSLPIDIQLEAVRHIPALRNVEIYRPGYAIEYDYFDPTQLMHSLETKRVRGLFFAGQINGTTGYEEAAGQGLVAGINAAINATRSDDEPFVLRRDEAYIGVLIDDLVTKGVDEPYRMFTSRAEFRILLRQDDADFRLTEKSFKVGLATRERYDRMIQKRGQVEKLLNFCDEFHVKLSFNDTLTALNSTPLKEGTRLTNLINRPELNIEVLAHHIPELQDEIDCLSSGRDEVVEAAEVRIKYAGYIERERLVAEKIARLELVKIPRDIDYDTLSQLTIEARQKLSKVRPVTIGQASRIPGVSPADVNILLVLLGR